MAHFLPVSCDPTNNYIEYNPHRPGALAAADISICSLQSATEWESGETETIPARGGGTGEPILNQVWRGSASCFTFSTLKLPLSRLVKASFLLQTRSRLVKLPR